MTAAPSLPRRRADELLTPVSRGLAAFLGGFTLLNLAGDRLRPGFDANFWWINLHPLPAPLAGSALFAASVLLLAWAVRPAGRVWRMRATASAAVALAAFAAWNAAGYFALLARHHIHGGLPVPLSLGILAALLLIARQSVRAIRARPASANPRRRLILATFALCVVGFPLAQILTFGQTDYRDFRTGPATAADGDTDANAAGSRRPADAIVVLGARAYADGSASQALADRVRTACDLYRRGYARRLVFSGGPGDGPTDEPHAMRRLALSAGVPDAAIVLDPGGLNTDATVRDTAPLLRQWHAQTVLVVSHAWHLPRVKMAYRRQGWDVYTVPARESRTLSRTPFLVCREVVALWAYYLAPPGRGDVKRDA